VAVYCCSSAAVASCSLAETSVVANWTRDGDYDVAVVMVAGMERFCDLVIAVVDVFWRLVSVVVVLAM